MQPVSNAADILAARAGDRSAFARLIAPYRQELLVHYYRILGSTEDAIAQTPQALPGVARYVA